MAIWLYIFFSWTFCVQIFFLGHASWACHLFSLFLFYSPCLNWKIWERERSLNMEFYFVDGWNMVANFQCRSLAGGVHVILIKQVWKDISLGSQSLKKLKATTRHICVRFVSWRSTYGSDRTNKWSYKAMEVFFLIKVSQTYKQRKARILPSNHIALVNNSTIMGSLRYDSQAQA